MAARRNQLPFEIDGMVIKVNALRLQRILGNLAQIISNAGSGRGLISVCTAGGMGVAAILEKE